MADDNDFLQRYKGFYRDIYEFHKKYHAANEAGDFKDISDDISILGAKYPTCRGIIVETFNLIEKDYIERGN